MNITKNYFLEHGIVKDQEGKALELFSRLCPDFTKHKEFSPSKQIEYIWREFSQQAKVNNSLNGKVFEYAVISVFINNSLLPLYIQAKVAFVPNVDFDLMLYTSKFPIALSLKTSLRERYKQADLEAIVLKNVHRNAKTYLLTLDELESRSVNKKIESGDVIGIDKVIYCLGSDFDSLIQEFKAFDYLLAKETKIIEASSILEIQEPA